MVALFDSLAAGMSDDNRKILLPPKAFKWTHTPSKAGKFLNNATVNALVTFFLLEDMRLAILLSKCSTDVENS